MKPFFFLENDSEKNTLVVSVGMSKNYTLRVISIIPKLMK